jgi:hypothetical protein
VNEEALPHWGLSRQKKTVVFNKPGAQMSDVGFILAPFEVETINVTNPKV